MSEAIQCDNCGAFYPEHVPHIYISAPIIFESAGGKVQKDQDSRRTIHLCLACWDLAPAWLKGPPLVARRESEQNDV